MKSAYRFVLIMSIALFSLYVPTSLAQDTEKSVINQQMPPSALPDFFFNPLEYSQQSFTFFLKRVYNHNSFPQEFLALNFLHVVSGISLAPQSNQPRRFIKQILNLFDQKLIQIYINPYAFTDLLNQIIIPIARYCNIEKEKNETIEAIKHCIGNCLVDNFHELQHNPDTILTDLAQDIYALTNISSTSTHNQKDITIRELQHAIHHFMARGITNLIWSPTDHYDTWMIARTLARLLETCAERYMIDTDMLDDLLWTLLKRYTYFISLADFDQSFFERVQYDLATEKEALWLLQEREAYITTKLEYLQSVLMEAEIAARMRASGLIIPGLR